MIKHQNKIIAQKALAMRAKNINGKLKSTVAKQEAMTALQQKEFHATTAQQAKELKALTATLKEQASQIQKVSDRLEHLKPTKKDLMISKIISGAACDLRHRNSSRARDLMSELPIFDLRSLAG